MRCIVFGLAALLSLAACDRPDQVYVPRPKGFDPVTGNGLGPIATHFTGKKGFQDETLAVIPTVPTTEVCTTSEVSDRWAAMVKEPIVPMKGAGGLDMTGGKDWTGLTIDEAQSRDVLCQTSYYGDGVAAWGDNYEVIAFFSPTTRLIDDILVTPGYLGTIQAGNFEFEVNEPITKDGVAMNQSDGSALDPRTEDSMRAMDRALINAFRPSLNASQVDCVASGSCYIIMSGTLPVLVFMSVGLYVVLEPQEERIVQIEVSLKRPFRIGAGKVTVEGLNPTILGTTAAGIPDCKVTYGTTWKHIREKCLADNPLAMATVQAANGYENIVVHLGGVLLYFERKGLAVDEILPITPVLDDGDTVGIVSVNAEYEGDFSMPYSEVLEIYKKNLDALIRAEVKNLKPEDPTGVELLRTPKDHSLPEDVTHAYPDRLRPGGIYAAFCVDDTNGDGTYDDCFADSSGRPLLPLVNALQYMVADTLGDKLTPKLSQLSPYVQEFERALAEHFNGKPLVADQLTLSPDAGAPDRIYATTTLFAGKTAFTINVYYGGNDDRMHFLNFQKGSSRMEAVLLRDAALATPEDTKPTGVFTLMHLLGSPRLGLGAAGTVTVDHAVPETRRALLNVAMTEKETAQVLAPYMSASAVSGYWRPLKGPQDEFVPADTFSLFGNTLDAQFWMLPVAPGSADREIVAVQGNSFFGDVYFCGLPVHVGSYASDLVGKIADNGYGCQFIVRHTENFEFVSELVDLDGQVALGVANDMVTRVLAWSR